MKKPNICWFEMRICINIVFFLFFIAYANAQNIADFKEQAPLKLNGNFTTSLNFTGANDSSRNTAPFIYYISGNLNTSVYGISFPISYTFSKNNSEFSNPFYRLGASPEYKWAKLHVGYRSISFSDFTLAGHNFLGGGLELNPGVLRVGAVYGRFGKKKLPDINNPLDTIAGFSRKGYGLKLGVGKENNYIDLLFTHIADDTTTLEAQHIVNAKSPQVNSILGAHTLITIAEKLVFEAEGAISAYTDNRFADDFNPEDLVKASQVKWAKRLDINTSSYYSTALTSTIQYNEKNFSLGLQYRRIDPGYKSMGAYYFTTDVENITINTNFRLLEQKLSIRSSVGIQNNNLKNNKKSTTGKVISKLNFSYKPSNKYGITGNYTNYSIDQKPGRLPLNDTIKLYQVNSNFSLNPYLMFFKENGAGMLNLTINLSDLNDRNPNTSEFTEVQNKIAFLNYSKTLVKPALNYTLGITYNTMQTFSISQNAFGGNGSISKSFLKNKLNLGINASVQKTDRNDEQGLISNGGINSSYSIQRKHRFRFRILFTSVSYPDGSMAKSYNRYQGTFSYSYSFKTNSN